MSPSEKSPDSAPTADSSVERLIEVAPIGAGNAPGTLTYSIPANLEGEATLGCAVEIPLGRRRVTGFIVGENEGPPPSGLKPILRVLPDAPLPGAVVLALIRTFLFVFFLMKC